MFVIAYQDVKEVTDRLVQLTEQIHACQYRVHLLQYLVVV
jgi:hypothetical protein